MTGPRIHFGHIPLVGDGPAESPPSTRPLFLLADSHLLFWTGAGGRFVHRLARLAGGGAFRAAYLGASNGDQPEYYQMFQAAMAVAGAECRMIPTAPSGQDMMFLRSAGLVLLAGGDVQRGWTAFERSGVREAVARRHEQGAVLVGVSAGAVQLGMRGGPRVERRSCSPPGGWCRSWWTRTPRTTAGRSCARRCWPTTDRPWGSAFRVAAGWRTTRTAP